MIITLFCFFFFYRGAKIPEPPEGHKWQKVINDNKVKIIKIMMTLMRASSSDHYRLLAEN